MKKIIRFETEYEELKQRYFDWLQNSREPLNMADWAYLYEGVELVG